MDAFARTFFYLQTALNIIKLTLISYMVQNIHSAEYNMNTIHNLSSGSQKIIHWELWLEIA